MKYSQSLEQACCIMGLLAVAPTNSETLTNGKLSAILGVSPSYLKKITTKLVSGGLIRSSHGVNGGFSLAKPLKDVSLLDVVVAIEGERPLFQPTGLIERVFHAKGRMAKIGLTRIESCFARSEEAAKQELQKLTLATIAYEVKENMNV